MFLVFLTIDCLVLDALQHKRILPKPLKDSFVSSRFKYFTDKKNNARTSNKKPYLISILGLFGFSKKRDVLEIKHQVDLNFERIRLNNKLKILKYILEFELYLSQNKIDKNKFSQMKEFNNLKLSTQKSILKSTRKISSLSTHD